MRRFTILLILLAFSLIISACSGLSSEPVVVTTLVPEPTRVPITVDDPADLGAAVFTAHCVSCHGINGQGDGMVAVNADLEMADFTDPITAANQSRSEWTNTIRYGRLESIMPPWENSLTEEELIAVSEYTYTLADNLPQDVVVGNPTDIQGPEMEESIGRITGRVINGTAGEDVPEAISVALHVLDHGLKELSFEMQILENTREYAFEDITIRSDQFYLITAIHNETVFSSEQILGLPTSSEMYLPVTIYEATSDPSVIEIDVMLTRIMQDGEELVFQQLYNFHNTSDRIFQGENQIDGFNRDSVRIPLPENARIINNIELVSRFVILEQDGQKSLVDTQAVLPNSDHVVEVVYAKPYSFGTQELEITQPVNYDVTNQIELMVQLSDFAVAGEQMQPHGTQHFQSGMYRSYLAEEISAGEQVSYTIVPAEIESMIHHNFEEEQNDTTRIIIGVLGGVLIFIAAVGFWTTRTKPLTRDELAQQIAALDVAYERGELEKVAYEAERSKLKRQLAALMEADA